MNGTMLVVGLAIAFGLGGVFGVFIGWRMHRKRIADQFEDGEFFALPVTALAARICVSCLEPFERRVTKRQIAVAQCERCLKEGRTIKPFRSLEHAERVLGGEASQEGHPQA